MISRLLTILKYAQGNHIIFGLDAQAQSLCAATLWKLSFMKYRIVTAFALLSISAGAWAQTPCQEKEQDIQREISYAQKHNNQSRITGLKKALSEVKANCSDSQLRADHQKKIADQKEEVAERQEDLKEARQKGDAEKVTKRENKLKEAQDELKALESRDY